MTDLYEWAIRHSVPAAALHELQVMFGTYAAAGQPDAPVAGQSEAAVQNNLRLTAGRAGVLLFRNNVGGDPDSGLRWGLANDSAAVNKVLASSDLIGIDRAPITPADVGKPRGQFVAMECKAGDWNFTGAGRETPQHNFIKLIISRGGRAAFNNNGVWANE
jgi:hypothetical protein